MTRPDRRRQAIAVAAFVLGGLLALLATRASGQAFETLPLNPKLADEKFVKQLGSETKSFASTGRGRANMANAYIGYYIAPKMTDTSPEGIAQLSSLVDETNTLLLRAQRSNKPDVFQQVTQFVYNAMKKLAEGNYHPPARINAALILSRLDRVPANNSNRTPPVPLIQTYPILLNLYQDENNADGVRAAALQGLHRHVMYGFPQITGNNRTTLQTAMTELLESDPPAGRSAQAHAYLQRFAVDILDMFRPQKDPALGVKLISISTEPKNPNLIALYSASRLAPMGSDLKGRVQAPEDILQSWSRRLLGAFKDEMNRLMALERPEKVRDQPPKPESMLEKKTVKPRTTQMQMGMGMMDEMEMMGDMEGAYDMDMEMEMDDMDMGDMEMMMMGMGGMGMRAPEARPQPPEVVASRQILNLVLQQVHLGVTGEASAGMPDDPGGLLASLPDDQKKVVEDWVTTMESIVTGLNDPLLDDREKYIEGLDAQIVALQDLAGVEEEAVPAAAADPGLPAELMGQPPAEAAEAAPAPAAPAAAPAGPAPAGPAPAAPAPAADEVAAPPADELAAP